MHPLAFGERECLANKAAESLAQGVVEAFDVAGLARPFVAGTMSAPRINFFLGQPEVATRGPAAVVGRNALAQSAGTVGRTISHEVRHDLAGLSAERDPTPSAD